MADKQNVAAAETPMTQPRETPKEIVKGTWRLETPHYWRGDVYLEEGTLVGEGTEYPFWEGFRPSQHMVEVDSKQVERRPRPQGLPGQGGRRG